MVEEKIRLGHNVSMIWTDGRQICIPRSSASKTMMISLISPYSFSTCKIPGNHIVSTTNIISHDVHHSHCNSTCLWEYWRNPDLELLPLLLSTRVCFHIQYNERDALKSCHCFVKSRAKESLKRPKSCMTCLLKYTFLLIFSIFATSFPHLYSFALYPTFFYVFQTFTDSVASCACHSLFMKFFSVTTLYQAHFFQACAQINPMLTHSSSIFSLYYFSPFFCFNHLFTHMKQPTVGS